MKRKYLNKISDHKIYVPIILLFVLMAYFFIVFLPFPSGINTGLDPSWFYVISYASSEQLTYGKDIIFTYGPLGYLIHGSVIDSNFFAIILFRFFIHFLFIIVITIELIKIYKGKQWINLLLLILSFILYYFLGGGTDYSILFIFLSIIPYEDHFHKKYQFVLYSLFLGIISGFCLTTKFSLGICAIGVGILYFGTHILGNSKIHKNITRYLYQLFVFTTSALWTASIILDAFSKDNASLIDYLKNSLAISSGYSSAMSIVTSYWEVVYALSQIILVLILLIITAQSKENSIGYNISLAFVLWITFKHGFIRQDGHVLIFIKFIPLIVYLCKKNQVNLSINKKILFGYLVQVSTIVTVLIYLLFPSLFGQIMPNFQKQIQQTMSFSTFSRNINSALNLGEYKNEISKISEQNLSEMKLPSDIVNALKNQIIDVIPWEISLISANNFNWQPRPIFQSYSAYTSSLDKINSKSLMHNKPHNIIYNFMSIDQRHPFFDEPETFLNIFCNYQISSEFSNFTKTKRLSEIMILQERESNICSKKDENNIVSINWNQSSKLEVKDKEIVTGEVGIEYSILGKIYKILFRSPPVMINITYADSQGSSYRIIPENSKNGVILSHLPTNPNEALNLFKGELSLPVKFFSFSTINPLLYKSQIRVDFTSYSLLDSSIKQKKLSKLLIDLSQLKNVNFTSKIINKYSGVMDSKSEDNQIRHIRQGEIILLNGWAFEKTHKQPKLPILITDDSNKILGVTTTGNSRPDVSTFFKQSSYANSGWSIILSSYDLPKDIHEIKAWIYEAETNQAIPITGIYKIKIQ